MKRKIIAALLGVLVSGLTFLLSLSLGGFLGTFYAEPVEPGGNIQGGQLGSIYYLTFIAVSISAGMVASYLIWVPRNRAWWRNLIIITALLVVASITGANFFHNDALIPYAFQAILNLVLAFFGAVVVLDLVSVKVSSNEGKVLRLGVIFLIVSLCIVLPLIFDFIWLLSRLGIPQVSLDANLIAALAALVGAAISALDYNRSKSNA